MAFLLLTGLLGLAILQLVVKALAWRNAYLAAKSTGFPVFLSPVFLYDMWFLFLYPYIGPFLNRLPKSWTTPWLQMAQTWNIWKVSYKPFQEANTNTFVLASPRGNMLWTCDPYVCKQLEFQHPNSQVDVEALKFFQLYGPNLGSVEGDEWKKHRRVIMTGFGPATNSAVWKATTKQVRQLIKRWLEDGDTIRMARDWTSRLALHVICDVFFGKAVTFKGRKAIAFKDHKETIPEGHRIPFDQAIFTVVENIRLLFMIPHAILSILPIQSMKDLHVAFTEWNMYLNELRSEAMSNIDDLVTKESKSIVESIVVAGTIGSAKTGDRPLPEDSILGNLFFMLMAGHETTGNTMAFILYLLAIYPNYQTKIQEDLDQARAERNQAEWSAEKEYHLFQKGWIGAAIKEVLRLYCVVQYIGRKVVVPINIVDSKGTHHTVPAGTSCQLGFAAAFHNPDTWAQGPSSASHRAEVNNSPALDFDPSRWLKSGDAIASVGEQSKDAVLNYFPFGQGPHACPGRLFALVKMTAMVATLFVDYNVELVVEEDTLLNCGGDAKLAWEETRNGAMRKMVDGIDFNLSIMLREPLPIRLVRRS